MPSTTDLPPFDYWAINHLRFSGRNGFLFYFRVRVEEPGPIPVKLRIQSRDLYQELVVDGTLDVSQLKDEPGPRDAISALIDEGEELLREAPTISSGDQLRRQTAAFVFSGRLVISELERPDLTKHFDHALVDYTGPRSGQAYYEALVLSKVRLLYDIRRHTGT